EVLDDVRDVDLRTIDAGGLERAIEELPGGTDERPADEVLVVARLLADEDDLGMGAALAEDRLRPALPEAARLAVDGGIAELRKRRPLRDERRRRLRGGGMAGTHRGSMRAEW